MNTPVNPSFTIQKWGLKGGGAKLYKHVFVMQGHQKKERRRRNNDKINSIYEISDAQTKKNCNRGTASSKITNEPAHDKTYNKTCVISRL